MELLVLPGQKLIQSWSFYMRMPFRWVAKVLEDRRLKSTSYRYYNGQWGCPFTGVLNFKGQPYSYCKKTTLRQAGYKSPKH
ncbi:hypothetical protein SUGI_1080230 [Cryptomeria japonica]|nr:hypothetical protein SUGI_1080230 [Cryptomeria japonica]